MSNEVFVIWSPLLFIFLALFTAVLGVATFIIGLFLFRRNRGKRSRRSTLGVVFMVLGAVMLYDTINYFLFGRISIFFRLLY